MKIKVSVKKLLLSISSVGTVLLLGVMNVHAQEYKQVNVVIDGVKQNYSQPAVIVNGSTLVPLRAIFEELGATVEWNAAAQTVIATKKDTSVRLTIGHDQAYVNNEAVKLAAKARIINSRTMVPLRFVGESLGADVKWNGATSTVNIQSVTELQMDAVSLSTSPTYEGIKIQADSPLEERLALAMINGESRVDLADFERLDDFTDVFTKVIQQNPLILGVTEYEYGQSYVKIRYNDAPESMKQKRKEIINKVKAIIADKIEPGMTEEEKFKSIFDYLENNAKYDYAAFESTKPEDVNTIYKDSYSTYGVMIKGLGVCQSYANSFKLLSDAAGLTSIVVSGTRDSGAHAWNKVKLSNGWYNVDVTDNATNVFVQYKLFLATDKIAKQQGYAFDKSYWIDDELQQFDTPAGIFDYYTRQGLVATTIDEYKKKFVGLLERNQSKNTLRLSNDLDEQSIESATKDIYRVMWAKGIKNFQIYLADGYAIAEKK